jgi:hypothetical protein
MKSKYHPREKNKSLGRAFILNPDEILLAMTQVITFFSFSFSSSVMMRCVKSDRSHFFLLFHTIYTVFFLFV